MSESTVPVSDLTARYVELLPSLVTRGRRAAASGALAGVGELLGATEALAVDLLRALTRVHRERPSAEDWTETLARSTGARVLVARRPFLTPGRGGPEAFERALIVSMLWDLRRVVAGTEGLSAPRMHWERGLPISIADAGEEPRMLFLTARRRAQGFGNGLAIGFANRGQEAAIDLLVPVREPGEAGVYALQVRRGL